MPSAAGAPLQPQPVLDGTQTLPCTLKPKMVAQHGPLDTPRYSKSIAPPLFCASPIRTRFPQINACLPLSANFRLTRSTAKLGTSHWKLPPRQQNRCAPTAYLCSTKRSKYISLVLYQHFVLRSYHTTPNRRGFGGKRIGITG